MKSLHKIILFALLPLMGACSGMLDIEPHSAVSPTVVGSDDIEALRIGMYNKVQEGPTYYSTRFPMRCIRLSAASGTATTRRFCR